MGTSANCVRVNAVSSVIASITSYIKLSTVIVAFTPDDTIGTLTEKLPFLSIFVVITYSAETLLGS